MKLELQPMKHRSGALSSAEFAVAAINPKFGDMIWELKRKGGDFEEMSGQFRIYRDSTGVIILDLKMDDLFDIIEDDLDSPD